MFDVINCNFEPQRACKRVICYPKGDLRGIGLG